MKTKAESIRKRITENILKRTGRTTSPEGYGGLRPIHIITACKI